MEFKKILSDVYQILSKYGVSGLKVHIEGVTIAEGDISGEPLKVKLSKIPIEGELFFNEKATPPDREISKEILQFALQSLYTGRSLARQTSDIGKLGGLTKLISSNLNLSKVIKELLKAGMELTGVSHTSILLIDPIKLTKGTAYEMFRGDPELHTYLSTARMTKGISHKVINTKKSVIVEDLRKFKGLNPVALKKGRISVLAIPLVYKDRINGIFYANSDKVEYFDKEILEKMEFIASQASIALENAHLYEEATRRLEALSLVNRVSNALVQSIELEKMLGKILSEVVSIFKLPYGIIFIYDDENEIFKAAAWTGYEFAKDADITIRLTEKTIASHAVKMKKIYYAPDVGKDPYYFKINDSISSEIAIPLHVAETLFGVIVLSSVEKEGLDENDIMLLSAIANNVSMAVQNAKLFENTKRLSMIDPLTGVYNRRKATSVIEQELKRSTRFARMFTILFVDLDNFKQFNDENGHIKGDEALREIARILGEGIREIDILARYGGDEFLIILMETSSEQAIQVAERIRESAENYNKPGNITLSIGVATFPTNGQNLKKLIHNADRACYTAKNNGGNRIIIAK